MTRVIPWEEMKVALESVDQVAAMEAAFRAYSEGRAVVPPVGELILDEPGEPEGGVHIKYGYVRQEPDYVVKIGSGFPDHDPPGNGLMMLFDRTSGAVKAVLLDEGHLTNARTGAAGALVAKHLAPRVVSCLGVIGTGVHARIQLEYLKDITPCRKVLAWGRDPERAKLLAEDLGEQGFEVQTVSTPDEVGEGANLIVTTTAAEAPLLTTVRPGAHITAMGSDTESKQELSPGLVALADVIVVDSREQCELRGELARARDSGVDRFADAIELGEICAGRAGRTSAEQVSIADLTGVAVQDHAIARAVFEGCSSS